MNEHPTTIHDNNVVDRIDYLKLENALIKAEEKEDRTQRQYINLQHALEERNQHVTVLTETIDALQSTSGQSTDRIAQELERQAQNNEQGGGEEEFDGSILEMLNTTSEEEALRSRVVVLTAQTVRAQTSQAQLRAHAETLEHMVERGRTVQRRLEEKVAVALGRCDRSNADVDAIENELEKERSENKSLNDTVLGMDRKMQSMKLEIETNRLQVNTAERERDATEVTLRSTQARHIHNSKNIFVENENIRKSLMNNIITLRVTVATMHASGVALPTNNGNNATSEEKASGVGSDLLALAEYIDVEDLVHRRSSIASSVTDLTREMKTWIAAATASSTSTNSNNNTNSNTNSNNSKKKKKGSSSKQEETKQEGSGMMGLSKEEMNDTIQSLHYLVNGLMNSILNMDRSMLETYRDARVSRWELAHVLRKKERLEEYVETQKITQFLPSEMLKVERHARAAKESLLISLSTSDTETLRSRMVAYQEHLRTANANVLTVVRERDRWHAECVRWKRRSQRERAEESQSSVGSRIVQADRALRKWEEETNRNPNDSSFWNNLGSWVMQMWKNETHHEEKGGDDSMMGNDLGSDLRNDQDGRETDGQRERQAMGTLIIKLTRELLALKAMREGDDLRTEQMRTTLNELRLAASSADDDLDAVKMANLSTSLNAQRGENKNGNHTGGSSHSQNSNSGGQDVNSVNNSSLSSSSSMNESLATLVERLATDARLEESHARQDEVTRLNRSLRETQSEVSQLQEWKEMSMVREERVRIDASSEVQTLRLEAARLIETTTDSHATVGASREITRLRSVYAALQMKYDRDTESLRLINSQGNQNGNPIGNGADTQLMNGIDVNELMAAKFTLEAQLLETKAIEKARNGAFNELENKIIDIARRSLGSTHARTRGGKTIDPSEELAKELISSKIKISEYKRKMRVMARTETDLRDAIEKNDIEKENDRENRRLAHKGKGTGNRNHINIIAATSGGGGGSALSQSHEDQVELVRQLSKSVNHVKRLERELSEYRSVDGGGDADVDVRALYEQVAHSASREKKMKIELISTRSELKSLRATLDQIVTGRDSSSSGGNNTSSSGMINAGSKDVRQAKEKAIDARIIYLEDALKTSENQRRRLERQMVPDVFVDEEATSRNGGNGGNAGNGGNGGGDEMPSTKSSNGGGRGDYQIQNSNNTTRPGRDQRDQRGSRKGRTNGMQSIASTAMDAAQEDLMDEIRRLKIEKRQSVRDISNLKTELVNVRSKLNKHSNISKKQKNTIEIQNEEERDEWAVKENGYEQRITKLRRTIKSLQETSGNRAAQAEQAVDAIEEELKGQLSTIKSQLSKTKTTLKTTRNDLKTAIDKYEISQRKMEEYQLSMNAMQRERQTNQHSLELKERVEMNSIQTERTSALEREIVILKETTLLRDTDIERARNVVQELQITNQELVTRLKTTGREKSAVEAQRARVGQKKEQELNTAKDEIVSLTRVEKHLKSQLREMAETNSELLARLNAHAATSATSRLEARTIRQEAEGLQAKMMNALRENEETLDQSMLRENETNEQKAEVKRLTHLVEELELKMKSIDQNSKDFENNVDIQSKLLIEKDMTIRELQSNIGKIRLENVEKHSKSLEHLTNTMNETTQNTIVIENEKIELQKLLAQEKLKNKHLSQGNSIPGITGTTNATNTTNTITATNATDQSGVQGAVQGSGATSIAFGMHTTQHGGSLVGNLIPLEQHHSIVSQHTTSVSTLRLELKDMTKRKRDVEEEKFAYERQVGLLKDDLERCERSKAEILLGDEKIIQREKLLNEKQKEKLIETDAELHSIRVQSTEDQMKYTDTLNGLTSESNALQMQLKGVTQERTELVAFKLNQEKETQLLVATNSQLKKKNVKNNNKINVLNTNLENLRLESIGKLQSIDEESKRRDSAHRQLASMFEEQVKTLRDRLLIQNDTSGNKTGKSKMKSKDVVITDLQI